jgi:hypothetical protein
VTEKRHVLVFPGGTEIGLEVRNALANRKEVALFSAGSAGSSHAPFAYRTHDIVPDVGQPGWFEALQDVIRARRIGYVFATHEDVLLELARRRDELGAVLVAPPTATIEIARSKTATAQRLENLVRMPLLLGADDPALEFPVFVKPDRGAGSRASVVVRTPAELAAMLDTEEHMLVMEYLPGDELTVDCLCDRERGLLYCGPRFRARMRAGISMDSYPVDEPAVVEMAEKIASRLDLWGAWFFQVRRDVAGDWCLLEVGARIGGTMVVSRARGANLPWLSILEAERASFEVLLGDYTVRADRALLTRYATDIEYDTVFVDLDDTLILDGVVNVEVVRFLYQARNAGKRIVVITRHAGDPVETLRAVRLAELPDEIVHLDREVSKSLHIDGARAILIDDSFGERADVARTLGIPTFDANMIDVLIDDRA